ncbi:MAG: hypothetical protein ACPLPR_08650 [Bacillota bacterium]
MRGLYGFHYQGKDKPTYNYLDSAPEWLGGEVVRFIRETPYEEMRKIFDQIVLVQGGMPILGALAGMTRNVRFPVRRSFQ